LRSFAHLLLQHLFKKKISNQVILTGANIVDDQNPKNKKRLDYVRFHTLITLLLNWWRLFDF
jgi:hypothetical protein